MRSSQVVPDTRTLVVGADRVTVAQVTEHLRQAGFAAISDYQQSLSDFETRESLQEAASWAGRAAETDLLVVVEVGGTMAYPSVAIKGIDSNTGELLWRGTAIDLHEATVADYNKVVSRLLRRALWSGLMNPHVDHALF